MLRYLKIESKNKEEDILLDEDYFKILNIVFDSPDGTEKKIDLIKNLVIISGDLNTKSQKHSATLSKWSLMKSTNPSAYRKLTIWIVNDDNKLFRKMEYPYCFVVDYNENYGGTKDTFELKLKQKEDRLEDIVISSEPLEFNPEKVGFKKEEAK